MTFKVPKMHFLPYGLSVTLAFYFLISKSNQFILIPKCIKAANSIKFSQVVCKILWSQRYSNWSRMDTCMHAWKECIRQLIIGNGIKRLLQIFLTG